MTSQDRPGSTNCVLVEKMFDSKIDQIKKSQSLCADGVLECRVRPGSAFPRGTWGQGKPLKLTPPNGIATIHPCREIGVTLGGAGIIRWNIQGQIIRIIPGLCQRLELVVGRILVPQKDDCPSTLRKLP
jgi:hypothetical protein